MAEDPGTVTELLIAWSEDENEQALEELMSLVYDHLCDIAANYLRRERRDHTLQPAALVNEAYLRLVRQNRVDWQGRTHFFAIAASMMRRILIDHAKYHGYAKRDHQETVRLSPDVFDQFPSERPEDLVALDDALNELAKNDSRLAKLVELRFFGGLKKDELATVLGISTATVGRDWRKAKAWLYSVLIQGDDTLI